MQMTLRTQALAALTALCVVAVGAVAFVLFPRGPVYGPADLLPADRTIAFFTGLDKAGAERISALLPIVHTLPLQDTPATFALVTMSNGNTAWLTFTAKGPGTSPGVTSSDPAALTLLADGSAPLSENPDFHSLVSLHKKEADLWAFVRVPAVSLNVPTAWKVAPGPISLSVTAQGMEIARTTTARAVDTVSTGIRPFFVNPVFSMQTADLSAFISTTQDGLAGSRSTAFAGLMKNWFTETFGPDLSLQYDLLPLFLEQSTIAMGKVSATGGLITMAEGTGDAGIKERLNALHTGFANGLAGVARMQRTFDEKFTYDNMRVDGSAVSNTREDLAGWDLHITTNGKRTFATAQNGRRFILSNNAAALRLALAAYPSPLNGPAPIAQGSMDPQAVQTLLQSWTGGEKLLPALLDARKTILQWQVLRSSNVVMLRMY